MKIFVHGFWRGFVENTDGIGIKLFLIVFSLLYDTNVEVSSNYEECDLLIESVFSNDTYLFKKNWMHTYLLNGESSQNSSKFCGQDRVDLFPSYSCILSGEEKKQNTVSLPLFIPYIYSNLHVYSMIMNPALEKRISIPNKMCCAIISNGGGKVRNLFLDALEKVVDIHYAGMYRNNVPRIKGNYFSKETCDFISQYKFIVSMENSREDTYITEKIINGFVAGIIPIYWGSSKVFDYFNKDRFICLEQDDEASIQRVIDEVIRLSRDPVAYLAKINQPVFLPHHDKHTIVYMVKDVASVIF
jgi:hypothetical protein